MGEVLVLSQKGFMRLRDILKVIPVGRSTWWAGVKSGRFPTAVKLGKNCTAWKIEDIEKLVHSFDSSMNDS